MTRGARGFGSILLLLVAVAAPAAGQEWVAEASAGAARYGAVAGAVGTRSGMLSVQRLGPRWLYLSAGVPLDGDAIPWAAAGGGGRLSTRLRSLSLGVDAAAHGFGYREPTLEETGTGLTLAALPYLGTTVGGGGVELRSGVMHHTAAFAGESAGRMVNESGLRGWTPLAAGGTVHAEARLVRAEEGSYPFVGAGVEVPVGHGAVWATAGRWLADDLDEAAWGVGGRIDLPYRVTLRAAYEREADDPLYWNGPRRGWSIGLSRMLGGRSAAAPAVPVAVRPAAGRVTIRLPLSDSAEPPAVGGDFNGWSPAPMVRVGDAWELSLAVAPGVYRYAFRRADGSWFVPDGFPGRADDGFGGHNATLVVAGS